MNNVIKSVALLLAAGSITASAAEAAAPTNAPAAKPANPSELFSGTIVAKGKGVSIKRSQLDDALVSLKASLVARGGQDVAPEQLAMLEPQVLQSLIQMQLLMNLATDADKAAGKALCTKRFDEIKTRSGSDEALTRQLKSVGMTADELQKKMTDESTAEVVLERELKVNVTDDDVKKFYDENPSKFEQQEMVRASHILLSTRDMASGTDLSDEKKAAKHKQMEEILKRARAGEDFAKLAKEYSEDPGSKDKGGEYTFPRGQMVPEFETAAFSLKTNEVSDIITTQFGYHIIKLSEKMPAHKVELEKVASLVKQGLKNQTMQKEMPAYLEKLQKDAGIEILDEKLKPKEMTMDSALPAGHPAVKTAPKPDAK